MRRTCILIFCLAILNSLCAQTVTLDWERTYGGVDEDEFNSIAIINDSTIMLLGTTESSNSVITNNNGASDVWLVKIDEHGNLLANNCYGGASTESGYSFSRTTDNGFILAGGAGYNSGQVHGVHGGISDDFWVIKTDSLTNLQWSHCYGGSEFDSPRSIIQTLDSGYLVVGSTDSDDFDVSGFYGGKDAWILKLNYDSTIAWSRALGGSDFDGADGEKCVYQANDGSIYIVANVLSNNGSISCNYVAANMWITKLTSAGNTIWQRCYGGSGLDNGFAILPFGDQALYVGGNTSSVDGDVSYNYGTDDYWLLKIDTSGSIIWEKTYGGFYSEKIDGMCITTDGGVAIAGTSLGNDGIVTGVHGFDDFWIIKVDSIGTLEWAKAFGGTHTDRTRAISQMSDGSYIVAGYTRSHDGDISNFLGGGTDAWVVKLSPPGMDIKEPEYTIQDISVFARDNILNTRFFSRVNEEVQMEIYNISGQMVAVQIVRISEGLNFFTLPGNFKAGSYCLKISGRNYSQSKVFVVVSE